VRFPDVPRDDGRPRDGTPARCAQRALRLLPASVAPLGVQPRPAGQEVDRFHDPTAEPICSALGRQRFRGFVRVVGADLPAHRSSEQLPASADRSSCRAGIRGAATSLPGSDGITPSPRCQRCKRIAEPKVRIRFPPTVSSLRTSGSYSCETATQSRSFYCRYTPESFKLGAGCALPARYPRYP
jgi:hypothetical protein